MKLEKLPDKMPTKCARTLRTVCSFAPIMAVSALLEVGAIRSASAMTFEECLAAKALFTCIAPSLKPFSPGEGFRSESRYVELHGRNGAPPVRRLSARLGHFRKLTVFLLLYSPCAL